MLEWTNKTLKKYQIYEKNRHFYEMSEFLWLGMNFHFHFDCIDLSSKLIVSAILLFQYLLFSIARLFRFAEKWASSNLFYLQLFENILLVFLAIFRMFYYYVVVRQASTNTLRMMHHIVENFIRNSVKNNEKLFYGKLFSMAINYIASELISNANVFKIKDLQSKWP